MHCVTRIPVTHGSGVDVRGKANERLREGEEGKVLYKSWEVNWLRKWKERCLVWGLSPGCERKESRRWFRPNEVSCVTNEGKNGWGDEEPRRTEHKKSWWQKCVKIGPRAPIRSSAPLLDLGSVPLRSPLTFSALICYRHCFYVFPTEARIPTAYS